MSKAEDVALTLSGAFRELSPAEMGERFNIGGKVRAAILRVKKPKGWDLMVRDECTVSEDGKYFEINLCQYTEK